MPLIGREARGGIIAYVFVSRNDTPAPIKGILVKKKFRLNNRIPLRRLLSAVQR